MAASGKMVLPPPRPSPESAAASRSPTRGFSETRTNKPTQRNASPPPPPITTITTSGSPPSWSGRNHSCPSPHQSPVSLQFSPESQQSSLSPHSSFSPQSIQSSISSQSERPLLTTQSSFSPQSNQSVSPQSMIIQPQESLSPQSLPQEPPVSISQGNTPFSTPDPSIVPHPVPRQTQAPRKLSSACSPQNIPFSTPDPKLAPYPVPKQKQTPGNPKLVVPKQTQNPNHRKPKPSIVLTQPLSASTLGHTHGSTPSHPPQTSNPLQGEWIVEGIGEAGGGGAGVCRGAAGMIGMVLSVVGNCMRVVEPARRNLIDDTELELENTEEQTTTRPTNLHLPRQVVRKEGDLYIIEEDLDVEEGVECSPSTVPGSRYHNNNSTTTNNNHKHHGYTTRRPLVVMRSPRDTPTPPPAPATSRDLTPSSQRHHHHQQRHHHHHRHQHNNLGLLRYLSQYTLHWFKSQGECFLPAKATQTNS
ncbi:uncharacterized protein LOC126998210 isoform X4 [Eriocheir sinensis]|uniref:uncharacterized protein LOC126998210 isoform X4 n=1 Tax=Eriocheir sinensis TaxID=95602 RepID=UPI0021C90008|nr:uncharacterized protein LOC126998210 isoform X4 [Eriocheir sinensis]XP_050715653.1 uncharacterized protein LOC126998210 isoform X4 [Eriocheir sinensis]